MRNLLKDLTVRHKEICGLYFQGLNIAEIANRMDLSINTVRAILRSPMAKSYLDSLRDKSDDAIIDRRKQIASMVGKALNNIEDILDDPNINPSIRLNASKDILDRGGYKPVEKSMNINMSFTPDEIEQFKANARRRKNEDRSSD